MGRIAQGEDPAEERQLDRKALTVKELCDLCLRLIDSKEGSSIRPIGLPVVEYLERRRKEAVGDYVFPGRDGQNAFGSVPNHWKKILADSPLADVTPHILRHSFASVANDLGFTEVTISSYSQQARCSQAATAAPQDRASS